MKTTVGISVQMIFASLARKKSMERTMRKN